MNQLKTVPKKEFLQELKKRVIENKISKEEAFFTLEQSKSPEIITEYKKTEFSKLTKEDWKKACEILEKDKNYQAEAKLWDSIDDE